MAKLSFVIQFTLIDKTTGRVWKTPNHNKNKTLDDYHGPSGIKDIIMKDLDEKIKKKLGRNCDVNIDEGKIVIVSQTYDKETGKKSKIEHQTDLDADYYFEMLRFSFYIMRSVRENLPTGLKILKVESLTEVEDGHSSIEIYYTIEF